MKNRAVANLSQRRRADRERAFFLPLFRFGLIRGKWNSTTPSLIENETRIAKLPPAPPVCEVLQYRAVQCRACAAGAFHMCGCKIDNRETKLHHLPIHNSKADLRFLHCYVAKEGGRIQSGHSLPFRFGSIACEITDSETLTCHVHARCYSAVFSATSLSTRVVKRTKRHNNHNGTILSQKKAGGSTA